MSQLDQTQSESTLSDSARAGFIRGMESALDSRSGFAAGKLGYAEQVWVASSFLQEQASANPRQIAAIRTAARFHATMQCGIFPDSDEFISQEGINLAGALRKMDFIAAHNSHLAPRIFNEFQFPGVPLEFNSLEPNRSSPYNKSDCYLPLFKGSRILLVTTPAEFLVQRANKRTFESVWKNVHVPWWEPAEVNSLAFPSIFDSHTRHGSSSSAEILARISQKLESLDFDVALIAASGLGVPIAARVKELGKVGISLGGHLQAMFGVKGKRWEDSPEWRDTYFNDSWVHMPQEYKPKDREWLVDDGAYW
jgi:hypothetical protein